MNTLEIGKGPIFKVYSEEDKSVNLPFYIDEEIYNSGAYNPEEGIFKELKLDKGMKIQHLPNNAVSTREILYLSGRSGSGKSYYAMKYIKEYKKKYKDRPIFLFTYLTEEDQTLKDLKVNKFKLDEYFLETPLEIDFFEKSLVLMDDIDMISDKLIYKKIREILDKILQTGRHKEISCIYTSHLLTNSNQTKLILNESHTATIYPCGLPKRNIEYFLSSYLGFDKKDIAKVSRIKSRWITFYKTFPIVVAYETGAYIAGSD